MVVSIASRSRTEVKTAIFERLVSSSRRYPVVAAHDVATSSSGVTSSDKNVTFLSHESNVAEFGRKIVNFNGKYPSNPARLGCLRWFVERTSYDYLWMLEDDTYARNFGDFASRYEESRADFVGAGSRSLPFWVANGWRVGDPKHASPNVEYPTAFWCVCRFSRKLAVAVLDQLKIEKSSSHHEIFLPYVLRLRNMTWQMFSETDRKFLSLNWHGARGRQHFLTFAEAVERDDVTVAHPIKLFNHSFERRERTSYRCYNDTNVLSGCVDEDRCPIRSPSLESCQHACDSTKGCLALVYNSYRECYLKRTSVPRSRDDVVHKTVSCIVQYSR